MSHLRLEVVVILALALAAGCGGDSGKEPIMLDDAKADALDPDSGTTDGTAPDVVGVSDAGQDSTNTDVPAQDDAATDGTMTDEISIGKDAEPDDAVPVDICNADCAGKKCGPDGCDGNCGECNPFENCSDDGQCEAQSCESSKDCDGDLVCNAATGYCVQCAGDEDCPEGFLCAANFTCFEVKLCDSDKDCKAFAMVCDKEAGLCVECIASADCDADQFCLENVCVMDACEGGKATCEGTQVVTCLEDGSAAEVTATCTATQYCDDGACHDQVCPPGLTYCENDVLMTCDDIGKEIVSQEDCKAADLLCFDGECKDVACGPAGADFCPDPANLGHCADDQMSFESEPCPDQTFCQDGACVPWLCTPGELLCIGDTATACDQYGAGMLQNGINCKDQGECCEAGQCVESLPEVCDGKDNNCNGEIDEGTVSPCGDCDPNCKAVVTGPGGDEPFSPPGEDSYGIEVDAKGNLVVSLDQPDPQYLWVSNSSENTVSKVSLATGKEAGRYHLCSNPSRTAVDLHGNVWVGCRNDGGVAKVFSDKAFCQDANDDGEIATSIDTNDDGMIAADEMLPKGQDECVRFIVFPGGSCQRGMGVDRDNFGWAGEWNSKKLRRLAPQTGATVKELTLSANPYGLVIDKDGMIWVSGRGGSQLLKVDPELGQIGAYTSNLGCFQPYGITLDTNGRVWIGNCCCWHVAYRFDPETSTWAAATVKARPRGVAASIYGKVYVANDQSNNIAVIDQDNMEVLAYANVGAFPIGVAVDFNENIWSVNQQGSSVTKLDPVDLSIVGEYPVGTGPYTYSDMSGYVLHNFTMPGDKAFYAAIVGDADGPVVAWNALKLQLELNAQDCGSLEVAARAGDTKADLDDTPWKTMAESELAEELEVDLAALGASGKLLEIRLAFFVANDGCTIKVTGINAVFVE